MSVGNKIKKAAVVIAVLIQMLFNYVILDEYRRKTSLISDLFNTGMTAQRFNIFLFILVATTLVAIIAAVTIKENW